MLVFAKLHLIILYMIVQQTVKMMWYILFQICVCAVDFWF